MATSIDIGTTATLNIELIKSTRGKNKAHIDGFLYTLNGTSLAGKQYWLCEQRGTCKARLTTSPNGVILVPSVLTEILSSHTHGPNPARSEMLRGYQSMKDRALVSGENTRTILTQGLAGLNESGIVALPTLSSVKRTIRRHKSLVEENAINHDSAAELRIPDKYRFTLREESFLIHDSGIGDANRMLIFCAPKMLSLLEESQNWFVDGTFKVVPEQFFQLYTIHAQKGGMIIPCVYALLTNKSELTYTRLFTKLIDIRPGLNPFFIMADFEKAAMNALESTFLSAVTGCFFHLSQNIYRKIQSAGLTNLYIENADFALQMKMLPSLAFVPESEVTQYFEILKQEFLTSAI